MGYPYDLLQHCPSDFIVINVINIINVKEKKILKYIYIFLFTLSHLISSRGFLAPEIGD